MGIPGTIQMTGKIAPTAETDTYPTHDAKYGLGGVHHVADLAARDAISAERRVAGMLCTVESDNKVYRLAADLTTWTELAASGDLSYTFTQGVPASVWTITHNLGKFPSVTIVDSGGTQVEGEVRHVTTAQLVVSFAYAFSGIAHLN